MNIIISDSFLDSIDNLSKRDRRRVRKKVNDFAKNTTSSGFSLHDLDRTACDDTFKSIRVNRDLRVILSQQGNKYILLYAGHHDDAYNWAEGKYLTKNSYGALYIKDNIRIEEITREIGDGNLQEKYDTRPTLLEKVEVSLSDLEKLGVDTELAENLVKIKDEDRFLDLIGILPQELAEGLFDIICGTKTVTRIYNELQDENLGENSSIEEALEHKNSRRRFYLVDGQDELEYIFNENIDKWKLFLHPDQENIVKMNFNGPALIEGGPGTGKTVVGLHRAVFLAKNRYSNSNDRILFCTYSKKLAGYIYHKLCQLREQKNAPDNIEVQGVDSLISRLIYQYNLTDKKVDMVLLRDLMKEIYIELDLSEDFDFYETEYQEVIQRYRIKTKDEYMQINRKGRKKSLQQESREKVWDFFAVFLKKKEANNLIDFEDRAFILYDAIKKNQVRPIYSSIIIDEAQDLSPIKLKVLNALVKEKTNNIFLLSDKHQRIYKLNSWIQDTGLNIVGRTHYLMLNYRTTKQIREFADKQFIETELTADYLREYKSIYVGPEPIEKDFPTKTEQYRYIVKKIKEYLHEGIQPYEIAVISPVERREIAGALSYGGIKYTYLSGDTFPEPETGVGISTMHGSKGLEFKVVIIANFKQIDEMISKEVVDEWYNKQKIRQIECLKYVACTRARDELIITNVN